MSVHTGNQILEKLTQMEKEAGSLSQPLTLYREILIIQSAMKPKNQQSKSKLTRKQIEERIEDGKSLIFFGDLQIEWEQLQGSIDKIGALLKGQQNLETTVPSKLHIPLTLLSKAVKNWFEGKPLPRELKAGGNEAFWTFVLHIGMLPYLTRKREALSALINEGLWRRGYCPICGGFPDFALLDKERGARWLVCARCDHEWIFQRLECAYCGTKDQAALPYFTDDKGIYRLSVCENCHRYLKTIDLRVKNVEVFIPLERFLTLSLDMQAQQDGYRVYPGVKPGSNTKRRQTVEPKTPDEKVN